MALELRPTPTLSGEEAKKFAEKYTAMMAAQNPEEERRKVKERLERSLEFFSSPDRLRPRA